MPHRAVGAALAVLILTPWLLQATPEANAQKNPVGDEGQITPEVAIREMDFASARRGFHTKLLRHGPAPENDSMPPAPEDAKVLEYASDGRRLVAWINRPGSAGGGRKPAILFLHGGFSFGPLDWKMTQAFRDSGYIVMTPTFRGENRQKGDFTLFYDEVDDVLAAAEELAKQPFVDGNNLFVAGHSNGGTLALLAAMASPRFRAAASFSGSPDQIIFCRYGFEGPVPFDSTNAAEYEMRSPLAYAGSLKCPARIYYGTREPHFALSSQKLAGIARGHGIDVQSSPIEGSHFSALGEERRLAIEFFRRNQRH